jgi:hypothetical protein
MWINPNCLALEETPPVAVEQTIRCDRCKEEIIRDRTILRIESGPRRHEEPIDLCPNCMAVMMSFINGDVVPLLNRV